jgi:steroid delta-isomerase-like uncharacterized protein
MSTKNISSLEKTKETDNLTAELNKALVRRVVEEIWNGGNLHLIKEMVNHDFTIHFSGSGEKLRGSEQVEQFYGQLRKAFPDLHFTIENMVAEEDKVVTHWRAKGTHKGIFKGIPPTGKSIDFTAMDIDRISDGKFSECWSNIDELTLMKQLGVFPER